MNKFLLPALALSVLATAASHADEAGTVTALHATIDRLADGVAAEVISDRRYLHQHPELSNREVETGKYIARRLRELGYAVQTGVAHNGVVGVLKGGKPGPVVALRSDMDALPVVEQGDLPFASKVRTTYAGKDVGVMHACGHDAHMGILLGTAKVFAQMRDQLPGTVKLIFQPAEEGTPAGEDGGAELMVREGVLTTAPKPEVIFGLHVLTAFETGTLAYHTGGAMASADDFSIVVHGKGSHGAMPWGGVDPIVVAAQIVVGLQTIASRQMNVTQAPVIVTVGAINGGVRNNIIPDSVTMLGTLRALDDGMRKQLAERVTRTATDIAASAGATAEVKIGEETAYPVTYNDPKLTAQMVPTMRRIAGDRLREAPAILGAEDFAFYEQKIPGLFVWVGVKKPGASSDEYAPNHSPRFKVDEDGLELGVKTLANLTVDYMSGATAAP